MCVCAWESKGPTPAHPKNKAFIAGFIKGQWWLIIPKNMTGYHPWGDGGIGFP